MKTNSIQCVFCFLTTYLFLFLFTSCNNELSTELNPKENFDNYKQVLKTEKFSCYENPIKTKNGVSYKLIKVVGLEDINIFFGDNDNKELLSEYANKSIFIKKGDDKVLLTLYTNVEVVEGGYIAKYKQEGGDSHTTFLPSVITKGRGQNTMDCVTDVYSNRGWVSVWLTVQTAFIRATGVAIVAACAINNM